MATIINVGDYEIVDVGMIKSTPISYIEDVSGIISGTIVSREYSNSTDGKNWNIYKPIDYYFLKSIKTNDYVRIKYTVVQNLTNTPINIIGCKILQEHDNSPIHQITALPLDTIRSIHPYKNAGELVSLIERDLNYYINSHVAIEVDYWSTSPDKKSVDKFLHEYSLHNVADHDRIRVVVKDNKMPEPKHEFSQWGIEFDRLEAWIEKSYYEEKFGLDAKPRQYDYMYFTEINRMYYISAVQQERGLNEHATYYTCVLKKYEDFNSTSKTDDALEFLKSKINIDDYDSDEMDEMDDITNDMQNLPTNELHDLIKSYSDNNVNIIRHKWSNHNNDMGLYYYDMTNVQDLAVSYNNTISINGDGGFSIMFWIKSTKNSTIMTVANDTILSIEINNGVVINYNGHRIHHQVRITDDWTCVCIGINNQHNYSDCYTYKIGNTVALEQISNSTMSLPNKVILSNATIALWGGRYCIRNIRISKHHVEHRYHRFINGIVDVQRSSQFYVIDDCKPNQQQYSLEKTAYPSYNSILKNLIQLKLYGK